MANAFQKHITDNYFYSFNFKKFGVYWLFALISFLFLFNFLSYPCYAAVTNYAEPVVSVASNNEPLRKVLDKISKSTGYKIEITEGWELKPITVDILDMSLDKSLRKIIRALGSPSNSIINYINEKRIKINIFDTPAVSSATRTKIYSDVERANHNIDEIVIPAVGDQPAMTREELVALNKKQQQEIEKMKRNPNEIVIPAVGDQPAMTREELVALNKKQQQEIEKMKRNPNEVVIPAEGDQPAMTKGELETLHEKQQQEIKRMKSDPNEVMIPAEGDQPAMTKGELEALHKKQQQKIDMKANNPNTPVISDESGDN